MSIYKSQRDLLRFAWEIQASCWWYDVHKPAPLSFFAWFWLRILIATWVLLRLCMRSLKYESYEAIRFLAEGDGGKKKYKKDGVRGCLVCVFKQQFSIFKQYFIHFYILFYPHVFSQIFSNNNFQFLNTYTKRTKCLLADFWMNFFWMKLVDLFN